MIRNHKKLFHLIHYHHKFVTSRISTSPATPCYNKSACNKPSSESSPSSTSDKNNLKGDCCNTSDKNVTKLIPKNHYHVDNDEFNRIVKKWKHSLGMETAIYKTIRDSAVFSINQFNKIMDKIVDEAIRHQPKVKNTIKDYSAKLHTKNPKLMEHATKMNEALDKVFMRLCSGVNKKILNDSRVNEVREDLKKLSIGAIERAIQAAKDLQAKIDAKPTHKSTHTNFESKKDRIRQLNELKDLVNEVNAAIEKCDKLHGKEKISCLEKIKDKNNSNKMVAHTLSTETDSGIYENNEELQKVIQNILTTNIVVDEIEAKFRSKKPTESSVVNESTFNVQHQNLQPQKHKPADILTKFFDESKSTSKVMSDDSEHEEGNRKKSGSIFDIFKRITSCGTRKKETFPFAYQKDDAVLEGETSVSKAVSKRKLNRAEQKTSHFNYEKDYTSLDNEEGTTISQTSSKRKLGIQIKSSDKKCGACKLSKTKSKKLNEMDTELEEDTKSLIQDIKNNRKSHIASCKCENNQKFKEEIECENSQKLEHSEYEEEHRVPKKQKSSIRKTPNKEEIDKMRTYLQEKKCKKICKPGGKKKLRKLDRMPSSDEPCEDELMLESELEQEPCTKPKPKKELFKKFKTKKDPSKKIKPKKDISLKLKPKKDPCSKPQPFQKPKSRPLPEPCVETETKPEQEEPCLEPKPFKKPKTTKAPCPKLEPNCPIPKQKDRCSSPTPCPKAEPNPPPCPPCPKQEPCPPCPKPEPCPKPSPCPKPEPCSKGESCCPEAPPCPKPEPCTCTEPPPCPKPEPHPLPCPHKVEKTVESDPCLPKSGPPKECKREKPKSETCSKSETFTKSETCSKTEQCESNKKSLCSDLCLRRPPSEPKEKSTCSMPEIKDPCAKSESKDDVSSNTEQNVNTRSKTEQKADLCAKPKHESEKMDPKEVCSKSEPKKDLCAKSESKKDLCVKSEPKKDKCAKSEKEACGEKLDPCSKSEKPGLNSSFKSKENKPKICNFTNEEVIACCNEQKGFGVQQSKTKKSCDEKMNKEAFGICINDEEGKSHICTDDKSSFKTILATKSDKPNSKTYKICKASGSTTEWLKKSELESSFQKVCIENSENSSKLNTYSENKQILKENFEAEEKQFATSMAANNDVKSESKGCGSKPESKKVVCPKLESKKEVCSKSEPKEEVCPKPEPKKEVCPKPEPITEVCPKQEPKEVCPKPEPKKEVCPKPEPKKEVCPKPEPKKEVCSKPEPKKEVCSKPEPKKEVCPKPKTRMETCDEKHDPCSISDLCLKHEPKNEVCSMPKPNKEACSKSEPNKEMCTKLELKNKDCSKPEPKKDVCSKPVPKKDICPKSEPNKEVCPKPEPKIEVCPKSELKKGICSKSEPKKDICNDEPDPCSINDPCLKPESKKDDCQKPKPKEGVCPKPEPKTEVCSKPDLNQNPCNNKEDKSTTCSDIKNDFKFVSHPSIFNFEKLKDTMGSSEKRPKFLITDLFKRVKSFKIQVTPSNETNTFDILRTILMVTTEHRASKNQVQLPVKNKKLTTPLPGVIPSKSKINEPQNSLSVEIRKNLNKLINKNDEQLLNQILKLTEKKLIAINKLKQSNLKNLIHNQTKLIVEKKLKETDNLLQIVEFIEVKIENKSSNQEKYIDHVKSQIMILKTALEDLLKIIEQQQQDIIQNHLDQSSILISKQLADLHQLKTIVEIDTSKVSRELNIIEKTMNNNAEILENHSIIKSKIEESKNLLTQNYNDCLHILQKHTDVELKLKETVENEIQKLNDLTPQNKESIKSLNSSIVLKQDVEMKLCELRTTINSLNTLIEAKLKQSNKLITNNLIQINELLEMEILKLNRNHIQSIKKDEISDRLDKCTKGFGAVLPLKSERMGVYTKPTVNNSNEDPDLKSINVNVINDSTSATNDAPLISSTNSTLVDNKALMKPLKPFKNIQENSFLQSYLRLPD